MTFDTMQWHESVTLHHAEQDYRRRSLVALALPRVSGRRVLDMRCLTGHLAVELAARGCEVTALDGYAGAVDMTNALARERGIEQPIAQGWDLTGLTERVGPRAFDCVVCLDVLNHVRDDEATVEAIAQVLAPGGRLVFAVPAFPSLLGPRDRALGHLRRYTRAGLRALMGRHGLVVETLRYWNFTALPLYVLMEKVVRRPLPDTVRYGRQRVAGMTPNRLLRWWYATVENHVALPAGLTLFGTAARRMGR